MDTTFLPAKNKVILYGIIFSLLLLFAIQVTNSALFTVFHLPFATAFIISRFSFWFCVLLIWLYAIKFERLPLLLYREQSFKSGYYIGAVVLLLIVMVTGAGTLGLILSRLHLFAHSDKMKNISLLSVPVKLFTVVTAGITEELIFRGYLLPRLQVYFKNSWLPVVISALFFGLAHAGYGTFINVFIPFYIGLLFGFHYQKYRCLGVLMICHILYDAGGVMATNGH